MSQLKGTQHLKIPFEEIKEATNNFGNEKCIGVGGYGLVYKGELLISGELTTVAIKRLDKRFGQGSKEFLSEIKSLKGLKHPNLISLLGYCDERDEKIIVYEYAENQSLNRYIKPNKTTKTLSWLERLRICVDVARGLDYLHNHAIIHRDIKSGNILLDRDWVAKVSDFGLSKLCQDRSGDISRVCGSQGYCDPQYIKDGMVTIESDVFSFGKVLLEILCGKLCYIEDDNRLLLSHYKKNTIHKIIDSNLWEQMSPDSIHRFLSIIYGCLHKVRKQRHPMYRVVKELEDALEIAIIEDGKKSRLASSDDLQGCLSEFPFVTLVTRRTNVGKIFDIFDLNKDGGLSRKEVAAFLFVTKPGEAQLRTCIDEVFSWYHKYIDGKKGLTYHGLLQYYDDGPSDPDSDIEQLVSDSDDSKKRKKLMWLFEKLNSNKDGDLNVKEVAAAASHKSLIQKIGGLPLELFSWYRKRGLTSGSLLTKGDDDDVDDDDVTRDQFDIDPVVLELLLKPDGDDDDDDALLLPPPESEDKDEPLTTRSKIIYLLIALLLCWITMILAKLKHVLVLFLILFNSVNVFLNDRQKMH